MKLWENHRNIEGVSLQMTAIESKESSNRSGIQVIARAAAILRALKENQSGMSLGEIARTVVLPRSTVQRIVAALGEERLIISEANGKGIRLGPELTSLAEATRYNIVESCRPFLEELSLSTGETADLSVMRRPNMIFLDQVSGTHRLRTISSVGETFPLTTTANGRACLSVLPREQVVNLIRQEWKKKGYNGDLTAFTSRLDRISETGFAVDLDEHTKGISAIGFAFRDLTGDLLSISVPVPSSRFADKRIEIENAIQKTAQDIKAMIDHYELD
jgi:DNA-binding IclR family transcriptional regulator